MHIASFSSVLRLTRTLSLSTSVVSMTLTLQEVPPVKKSVNPGDRSSRVEPKPKKRRVINREELTD